MNGNKELLVSIIVNCYNSDRYLKETLESIITQTYQNWEVIFWDNKSTDESAAYLKSYNEPRFKYFYAPSFEPLSTARNLAVEKASGEYIAFLDCDDLWISEKLALQMPYFENRDVGLVYSDFEIVLQSDSQTAKQMFNSFSRINCRAHANKNIYKQLLKSNFIIFSTVIIRRALFSAVGGFTNEFKHNEDYEILLKICATFDAVCIREASVFYRIHGGNNSYQNKFIAYEENREILRSLPNSPVQKKALYVNEARYTVAKIIHGQFNLIFDFFYKKDLLIGLAAIAKRKILTVMNDKRHR